MTERIRHQNRVAAFLCKAEWINETAPKTSENSFWKKSSKILALKMWYRFDLSWKIVVFIVQSGLKLQYDFSIEDGEWKWTQNVVVTGSEAADRMCQTNNESNIQLILHYNLFILTSGAAWTQSYINSRWNDVFCVVSLIYRFSEA